MKRTSREPSRLSESLQRNLNSYALAASAAGVSILALAQPAAGKIIYTPTHVIIGHNGRPSFRLDLNHDKITDFTIQTRTFTFKSTNGSENDIFLSANALRRNGVEGVSTDGHHFGSRLKKGALIDLNQRFQSSGVGIADIYQNDATSTDPGGWCNMGTGYLGLKFKIGDGTHFGWARLYVNCSYVHHGALSISATLTGYAYETIPYKGVIAGKIYRRDALTIQPNTLGALAAGALKPRGVEK
jgi:hypothetical protein